MENFITIPSWLKGNLIVALIFLLVSSILPQGGDKIAGVMIAGLFLVIAFVKLAKGNDRGESTRLVYTIGRYGMASILFLITGIQLYAYFTDPAHIHLSIYSLVVDSALIAYLVAFKPSNTTLGRKISKVIGYILVLIAVNALHKVRVETFTYYYPYSPNEINWGMFVIISIIMIAGVSCVKIGSKTTDVGILDDIQSDVSRNKSLNNVQGIMNGKTGNMLNYCGSKQKKYRVKQVLLSIILSMTLITILR